MRRLHKIKARRQKNTTRRKGQKKEQTKNGANNVAFPFQHSNLERELVQGVAQITAAMRCSSGCRVAPCKREKKSVAVDSYRKTRRSRRQDHIPKSMSLYVTKTQPLPMQDGRRVSQAPLIRELIPWKQQGPDVLHRWNAAIGSYRQCHFPLIGNLQFFALVDRCSFLCALTHFVTLSLVFWV